MPLPQHMRALVLTAAGLELQHDRPLPSPAEDEVLIAVHLAGVCATDIELTRGYKGGFRGILGHEFVGTVVHTPAQHAAWAGQRVVGEINIGCGKCNLCRSGRPKHCRQRTAIGIQGHDGAFAEYIALPAANLYAIPAQVSDEQAVFTEPLAAAFEILEQVPIGPKTRVIVQGDGRMGLLCAAVLATTGCDLTVIGRHPDKLALAAGAHLHTEVVSDELYARLRAEPADVVVEVTGSPRGFEAALDLVRPQGTIVLKSTFADYLRQFDISHLVVDEVSLVGSRCGPFDKALAAIRAGEVDVLPLVNGRYPLSDGLAAFSHAGKKGVLKVLIDPRA